MDILVEKIPGGLRVDGLDLKMENADVHQCLPAAQGVQFETLPEDWKCPVCKAGKNAFEKIG